MIWVVISNRGTSMAVVVKGALDAEAYIHMLTDNLLSFLDELYCRCNSTGSFYRMIMLQHIVLRLQKNCLWTRGSLFLLGRARTPT